MFMNKARPRSFLTPSLTGKVAFASSHCGWLGPRLLPIPALLSLPWELWEPAQHWASFEPWSHHAWPQQCAFVPCNRALRWKNGFIKSEKDSVPCTQQLLEPLSPGKRVCVAWATPLCQLDGASCSLSSWGVGALGLLCLGREQREPSKPQGTGRDIPCCQPCSSALPPSQRRNPARNSAMHGWCAGERISLADTTLDWVTEPFPGFSQVQKDHKGWKAFWFCPKEMQDVQLGHAIACCVFPLTLEPAAF